MRDPWVTGPRRAVDPHEDPVRATQDDTPDDEGLGRHRDPSSVQVLPPRVATPEQAVDVGHEFGHSLPLGLFGSSRFVMQSN